MLKKPSAGVQDGSSDDDNEGDIIAQPPELEHLRALLACGVSAFRAHCAAASSGGTGEPTTAADAALCTRIAVSRGSSRQRLLLPSVEERLWPLLESDSAPLGTLPRWHLRCTPCDVVLGHCYSEACMPSSLYSCKLAAAIPWQGLADVRCDLDCAAFMSLS